MNKIYLSFNTFAKLCNTFNNAKELAIFDVNKNIELTQENCNGIGETLKLRIPISLNYKKIENSVLEIDLTDVTEW